MKENKPIRSKPNNILLSIEQIADWGHASGLNPQFLRRCTRPAKQIANFFGISKMQSILFALICNLNFNRETVDIDDLARYLDCTAVAILKHMNEMEELNKMKIVRKEHERLRTRSRSKPSLPQIQYFVNRAALDAILNNEEFVARKSEKLDLFGFLDAVGEIVDERSDEKLSFDEMVMEFNLLMDDNLHQEWINDLLNMNLEENNLCMYLFLCHAYANDRQSVDLSDMLKCIFPDLRDQLTIRKEFIQHANGLIKKDLVELEDGFFRSDREIALTDHGIDLFLKEDRDIFHSQRVKKKDIIHACDISDKELFFSKEEEEKLHFLTTTLMPENFNQLSTRLKDAGMRDGMPILLYGPPGTGKTESAYQIARKTGRDIKLVIISETKSMWFGESEKQIKKVFDNYRKMVENTKLVPILLFNEADAIFSTRKKLGDSAVAQTENAIQNIILQEMEELNGILIATTNLTDNLDRAFERRFLYKIPFHKPLQEAMFSIWRSKVPGLPQEQVAQLAKKYELSGGQIDNVASKCLMNHVLHGGMPTLTKIMSFCDEETMGNQNTKRIGFQFIND